MTDTLAIPARPVRVAFVLPNLEVGGLQQATVTFCRFADRTLVEPAVVALHRPPHVTDEMYERVRATGSAIHDLQIAGRADRSLTSLRTAARTLKDLSERERFDLLDSATLGADLPSRVAARRSPTRHLTHLINLTHDPRSRVQSRARAWWRPAAARLVDRLSARWSDGFIAVTEAVRRSALSTLALPPDRVVVIPRGVDCDHFQPLPQPEPPSPIRVLAIGRLAPEKEHATLVRAVALCRDTGVEIEATIVGRGRLQAELEHLVADLGLGVAVRLLDPVADVRELHRTHHAYAMPSAWEGLGNALLEAMACARPVVTSDIDVFEEVTGGRALTHAVGDPSGLSERLIELAEASSARREELGAELRAHVLAGYEARRVTTRQTVHYVAMARG